VELIVAGCILLPWGDPSQVVLDVDDEEERALAERLGRAIRRHATSLSVLELAQHTSESFLWKNFSVLKRERGIIPLDGAPEQQGINSCPTIWHNSLDKPISNLDQKPREKQNYIYALPPLENLYEGCFSILYFFFHPPTYLGHTDANPDWCAYISAWGGEFCRVSIFAKPFETSFSYFTKIR
jgi:hypothetical protein